MERNPRSALPYNEEMINEFFDDIPVEKIGFFNRVGRGIGRFFRRLFGLQKKELTDAADTEAYSKFKHFYADMDTEHPDFRMVRHAATLCDDALRVATQRLKISKRLNVLEQQLGELEAFINLTPEEIDNLKRMLERFVAMAGERSNLLENLSEFDASLVQMQPLAEDAKLAIPQMKDAEKHQRALRMDIGYLSGEKEELIFERDDMEKNLKKIRNFTMFSVGVLGVISVILLLIAFNAEDIGVILWPTFFLVLIAMAFVFVVNVFRYRVKRDMKINVKKQQRAIELLNKKSVVYAYYTNFLRYCYKKYKANNSRTLENNLNDLEKYQHLANRIDTVRNLMYETETTIERFLREKKLGGIKSTIEGFAKTINLEDKRRRFTELSAEKTISDKTLLDLDKRHEEIWNALTAMNAADTTDTINGILEAYMNEAQALFATQNKENEEEEARPVWKLFELFAEGEEGLSNVAKEVTAGLQSENLEESA